MIRLSSLPEITGGTFISFSKDGEVKGILLDSRKASAQHDTVFFAIKGERHDGHTHLWELYQKGFRAFVIEVVPADVGRFKDCWMLRVNSCVDALQSVAQYHRAQFDIPVIGITGSNGKTIIKEWLYQMLSKFEVVVKNPGSYNSQIGVPLSVWQLQPHHTLALFEGGISKPNEMERLRSVMAPTIGLFTNLGSSHDEGFLNREQKIREKLKLFSQSKIIIYCKDHALADQIIPSVYTNTLTWGFNKQSDIYIERVGLLFNIYYDNKYSLMSIPFTDKASLENAFHTIAVMLYLGYNTEQIQEGIENLKAVPMRLELKEGVNQCQVIDDTYNNDVGGLEVSLQFLTQQNQKKNKTLILSDILQSGLPDEALVELIAKRIDEIGIQKFVGVGPVLKKFKSKFKIASEFFQSTTEFLHGFNNDHWHDEVILVKGARVFEFEKIVKKLQRKVHGTVMEINLDALIHNFNFFKSSLNPSTKIMVMVKAFAYGSGSNEIASILQYHRADYLGVAYADEGIELRRNNVTLPIMVMNPSEDSFEQILTHKLEPEIYNLNILRKLLDFLQGKPCTIHIKLDTGMHRLGFGTEALHELIAILLHHKNLSIASVFSHLAGADEAAHDDFTHRQADTFKQSADRITQVIGYRPLYHLLNSSGILRFPTFQFDMVRLGIALYGVNPTGEEFKQLKPVATLKTIISQINIIAAGETIGYGRAGKAEHEMKVGTIAIGYADGFSRAFSRGVGRVVVNGKYASVIGNVCMDMTMIDLTGITAEEGDEVVVFGTELPIQAVANAINTIPYEILTNTSERVKRIFITESL